jgi:hypothetical protein
LEIPDLRYFLPAKQSQPLYGLLLVLLLLGICGNLHAITRYTMDENRDGKPDQWFEVESGTLRDYKADRNYDGKIDHVAEFDEKAQVLYEEYDYNYDGNMDDFYFFQDGLLVRKEIDSNYDQKVDIWVFLIKGVYVKRIERDLDFDGEVDRIKDFSKNK